MMEKAHIKRWNDVARQFLGEDFFNGFAKGSEGKNSPPADVFHNNDEVIVMIELPGVENIQGLEMRVENEKLILKGKMENYYKDYEIKSSERQTGDFEKIIELETNVSNRYTSAKYRKGILELRFPKVKSTAQKIKLKNNR